MENNIHSRITKARKDKELTQQALADKLKVSFQTVSAWETGKYLPETDKLIELAKLLDVSVSWLVEDKGDYDFPRHKIFYNYEHMKTFVQSTAKALKLENTLKALPFATEAHKGQSLKHAEEIPYISHPLNMVCHLLAMNIKDDAIIAATLLHDVIEDCNKTTDDLPVDDEVKELVVLLTHDKNYEDRNKMLEPYYKNIATNPKASLIKLVDRCNNLTKMSWGLAREKQYRMLKETDTYVLPLLDVLKNTEYDNAKWLLSYQMKAMIDIYKRLL